MKIEMGKVWNILDDEIEIALNGVQSEDAWNTVDVLRTNIYAALAKLQQENTVRPDNPEVMHGPLICKNCGVEFWMDHGEWKFYASKGFPPPIRCPICRKSAKERRIRINNERRDRQAKQAAAVVGEADKPTPNPTAFTYFGQMAAKFTKGGLL